MTLPPIPPSDSLYKFTAIGGLILVVLSLYVPWKMNTDLKMEILDLELESRKRSLEVKQLIREEQEITELEKILTESNKAFRPAHSIQRRT